MASSSRGGELRNVHQDFIARIRYSNALPPPPNPPKLLEIPNTGLASGQYTTPGFASRLAREQPLNIEADAELGMPLDLVGMPGIFDGDESSIQAPAQAPPPHPHDKALLRSIQQLGKPKTGDAAVSFLRRTEYISSATKSNAAPLRSLNATPVRRPAKRKSPEPDKDSPAYVKRKIDQSFSITEQNLKDRSRVRHPSKRNVKLVDAFPLLPDLDAFPDSGAYVTIKFSSAPTSKMNAYDTRLLNGIFKPLEPTPAEEAALKAAMEAHEQDPKNFPKPPDSLNYDFYLVDNEPSADKFRQRFDMDNPDRDNIELYTNKHSTGPTGPCFQFNRVRAYETAYESELNHETKYDEELIVAFNEEDTSIHQKAAYFYPVMQRSTIRPQRTKNIARKRGFEDEDEQIIEQLDIVVDEPTDEIKASMELFKHDPYALTLADEEEQAGGEEDGQRNGDEDDGAEKTANRRSKSPNSDEELDADGDEED